MCGLCAVVSTAARQADGVADGLVAVRFFQFSRAGLVFGAATGSRERFGERFVWPRKRGWTGPVASSNWTLHVLTAVALPNRFTPKSKQIPFLGCGQPPLALSVQSVPADGKTWRTDRTRPALEHYQSLIVFPSRLFFSPNVFGSAS